MPSCDSVLSYSSARAQRRREMTTVQRLGDDVEEFCATTSAHGLPRAAASERRLNRYMWAVVFAVCLVAFALQACMMVEKFMKNEKIVNVELKFENIPFPAVTVCNLNPYKRSLAENMDAVSSMLSVFNEAMGKDQPLKPVKGDAGAKRTKRSVQARDKYALTVRGCQCVTEEQCLPLRADVPPGLAVDVCLCYNFANALWPCYPRSRYRPSRCADCSHLGLCQVPTGGSAAAGTGTDCWCQDVSHSCVREGDIKVHEQLQAYDNFLAIDRVIGAGGQPVGTTAPPRIPLVDIDDSSIEGSGVASEEIPQKKSYLHAGSEHYAKQKWPERTKPTVNTVVLESHIGQSKGRTVPVARVQAVQHAITAACRCKPSGCTNLSDRPPTNEDDVCVCLLDAHTTGVHSCLPTQQWRSASCTQCTSAGYCSVPAERRPAPSAAAAVWRVPCVCNTPHEYCVLAGRGSYRKQVLPLTLAAPEVWRAYDLYENRKLTQAGRAKRSALPSPLLAATDDDIERAQFEPALTRCYCDPKQRGTPDCRADATGPPGVNDTTCVCIYNAAAREQSADALWPCYERTSWKLRACTRCSFMGTCDYSPTDYYKALADEAHMRHDACLCTDYIKLCVKVDRPPVKPTQAEKHSAATGDSSTLDPVEEFFASDIAENATATEIAAESWLNASLTLIWQRTTPAPSTEAPKQQEAKQAMGFEGMTDKVAIVSKAKENLVFAVANMSESEKSAMSYTKEEFIRQCSFNGHECHMDTDFKQMIDPTFGNCYTFNFNKTENFTDRAGPTYGLRMELFVNVSEYLPTTEASGVRITVHPYNEQPFPDTIGFSAPTGSVSSFGIHLKRVRRLPAPFGDCVDDGKTDEFIYRDKSYTVEGCYRSCVQNFLARKCGCGDPRFPPTREAANCPADSLSARNCLADGVLYVAKQKGKLDNCTCPQPCLSLVYSVSYSAAKWPASFNQIGECYGKAPNECLEFYRNEAVLIEIYYEALNYESLGESEAYGWPNLMADFGGQLGLWMGVSVITVVEFVIFVWTILAAPCRWCCCRSAGNEAAAAGDSSASTAPIKESARSADTLNANGWPLSTAQGGTVPSGYGQVMTGRPHAPAADRKSSGLGLAARYRTGSLRQGDKLPPAPVSARPHEQYDGYFMV